MKTTHALWLTSEDRLLASVYPTLMSLAKIYALFPRHTPDAIQSRANRELKLRRPPGSGERKAAPSWERMADLLRRERLTTCEIAVRLGFSHQRATQLLTAHRGDLFVSDWRAPQGLGHWQKVWAHGKELDAPMPFVSRAKLQTNPFAAAAGLVKVQSTIQGRVYRNLTDDDLREAA